MNFIHKEKVMGETKNKLDRLRIVPNWQKKKLTCVYCGTTKSVKYAKGWEYMCNKCALIRSYKNV